MLVVHVLALKDLKVQHCVLLVIIQGGAEAVHMECL